MRAAALSAGDPKILTVATMGIRRGGFFFPSPRGENKIWVSCIEIHLGNYVPSYTKFLIRNWWQTKIYSLEAYKPNALRGFQ